MLYDPFSVLSSLFGGYCQGRESTYHSQQMEVLQRRLLQYEANYRKQDAALLSYRPGQLLSSPSGMASYLSASLAKTTSSARKPGCEGCGAHRWKAGCCEYCGRQR